MIEKLIKQNAITQFHRVRSTYYALQYVLADIAIGHLPGTQRLSVRRDFQTLKKLRLELDDLFQKDAALFAQGLVPLQSLKPESLKEHWLRFPKMLRDGIQIYRRRKEHAHHDFSPEAQPHLRGMPEYYQRNFHFQTDGYLSEHSADLYDHQVDVLFSGSTGAMRRGWMHELSHEKLVGTTLDPRTGSRDKILDLACGGGSSTRQLVEIYPKTKIIGIDLSPVYIEHAKKRLASFQNVSFKMGNAEKTKWRANSFGRIFSTYLFHELPLKARENVLLEAFRILKPQGFLVITDALQIGDRPEFDALLEDFPKNYHEPFFRHYTQKPLRTMCEAVGFKVVAEGTAFVSKYIILQKP